MGDKNFRMDAFYRIYTLYLPIWIFFHISMVAIYRAMDFLSILISGIVLLSQLFNILLVIIIYKRNLKYDNNIIITSLFAIYTMFIFITIGAISNWATYYDVKFPLTQIIGVLPKCLFIGIICSLLLNIVSLFIYFLIIFFYTLLKRNNGRVGSDSKYKVNRH